MKDHLPWCATVNYSFLDERACDCRGAKDAIEAYEAKHGPSQLVTDMAQAFAKLGDIERQVVLDVARRLLMGQETYGPFREGDERNMRQEAYEELLDGCVYLARDLRRCR